MNVQGFKIPDLPEKLTEKYNILSMYMTVSEDESTYDLLVCTTPANVVYYNDYYTCTEIGFSATRTKYLNASDLSLCTTEWEEVQHNTEENLGLSLTSNRIIYTDNDVMELTVDENNNVSITDNIIVNKSIEYNGIWLPEIPKKVYDNYKYSIILKKFIPVYNLVTQFNLILTNDKQLYYDFLNKIDNIENNAAIITTAVTNTYATYITSVFNGIVVWTFDTETADEEYMQSLNYTESGYAHDLLWSNHDIKLVYETDYLTPSDEIYMLGDNISYPDILSISSSKLELLSNRFRQITKTIERTNPNEIINTFNDTPTPFPNGTFWKRSSILAAYDIKYYNGIWLLVGRNYIKYSYDGINWTTVDIDNTIGSTYKYSGISYGNGTFVIINNYKHASSINAHYSLDGINWSASDLNFNAGIIEFGNGIFVVGCYSAAGGMCYSTNGINWTKSNITDKQIRSLKYANGLWIASCISNGCYYSEDGKVWTQCNLSDSVYSVDYSNDKGIWVAAGFKGLYYSEDGKTWNQSNLCKSTTFDFTDVKYANGIFITGCRNAGDTNNNGLYYSEDGKTWTQSNITTGQFTNIQYADGIYLATGFNYDIGILYSYDGKVWMQSNISHGVISCFENANGIWLASDTVCECTYISITWEP